MTLEQLTITRRPYGPFDVASRRSVHSDNYIAWAVRGATQGDGPLEEPGDDCWFYVATTEAEAREAVMAELKSLMH